MSRSWWSRTAFLVFLILFSCAVLTPTVVEMVLYPEDKEAVTDEDAGRFPPLPDWYEILQDIDILPVDKTLSLGLDLQGGLMLRYSVDIDSAIDDKLASNAANIRSQLAGMGKSVTVSTKRDLNEIPGLTKFVTDKISLIDAKGIREAVKSIL